MRSRLLFLLLIMCLAAPLSAAQPFYDKTHPSKTLGENRHFRIFLPPGYAEGDQAYPVIYYFHGHSDRYTLEAYDDGTMTVPQIADFVARHQVIVVAPDGYVAEYYSAFYQGSPWGIMEEAAGKYDFGEYFLELVTYIDSTYRTLTDRRHRATSGLSMGGFMSLYLSARYPGWIGSASSFNPGPEFYVGPRDRTVLWRPKDHTASHRQTRVRLIRASGDYISQYHEETREAYARDPSVRFEYRQDEYHKHAATSIGETFAFHMRAFEDSTLNNVPVGWSYSSAFDRFEAWGWQVAASGGSKGLVYLEDVEQGGLRISTRRWAPDGAADPAKQLTIITADLFRPGTTYEVLLHPLQGGRTTRQSIPADSEGRLTFSCDGAGYQVSFIGPGTGSQPPVLLPMARGERLYVEPGQGIRLPMRIYNPRGEAMTEVTLTLSSDYPTVQVLKGSHVIGSISPGEEVDVSEAFGVDLVSGGGGFAPARLSLKMTYDGWYETSREIDLAIAPEVAGKPAETAVLDGRTVTFKVFRQQGNQGGGQLIERTVTEGKGDGDGVLEPGEEATVWVRLTQGLDPFDKQSWHRTKVRSDSKWIEEVGEIEEAKQREWTSARSKTSVVRLSAEAPTGTTIPLLLELESWSFHYTPDVRYGEEPLYQAFQLHQDHVHRLELTVK